MTAVLEALLNGWWQGILLTLLVWLVLRDMPRMSAATRLAIWHLTLLVVILLPALQRIPMPHWQATQRASVHRAITPVEQLTTPLPSHAYTPPPSTGSPQHPMVEVPQDGINPILLILAFVTAAFQLPRLLIGYFAVRRLKRKARASDIPLPVRHSRPVHLLISERISMPMAVGYRQPAILLPSSIVDRLTAEEMRHVLLHESAHLRRYDDWIALAERIIRAVFFFQPAVYWIGRQIERERELACDDWVVAQSGGTKQYASSLARLAELGSSTRAPMLATGAGRRKEIFARLETLLDRSRNRVTSVSEPLLLLAGLALILVVTQGAQFSHLLGLVNFNTNWVESDGTNRREMRMRGDIEFTRDDLDVERMSPDALLIISISDGWNTRRVEFEADDQGVIQRRYYSGGVLRPFDAEGRRLLATFLPQWIREQGRDVPEHVSRLVHDKGLDLAIEDIRTIHNNEVRRRYLEELFAETTLNGEQLRRVLKIAGEMESDGEKKRFLEDVHDHYADRGLDHQILSFVDTIHSDGDRRQILSDAIQHGTIAETAYGRLFQSVGRINSDEDKKAVLVEAAQASKLRLPDSFFDAAGTIHSDGDRKSVLSVALTVHSDDPVTVTRALRTAVSMTSDEDKASVFLAAVGGFKGGEEMLREAGRLLSSIHSDGDRRRCLEALLDAGGKDAATLHEILVQALTINSDEDKSHVLERAASSLLSQDPVRRAFFSAVNTIHSSGDQRRVLLAVLARPGIDKDTLREISRSAAGIHSEEDQAAILKEVAERQ